MSFPLFILISEHFITKQVTTTFAEYPSLSRLLLQVVDWLLCTLFFTVYYSIMGVF